MAKQQNNKKETTTDTIAKLAAMSGKMPPVATEFEEAVLGALMLEHEALQDVSEILKPEHFYSDKHQRIYSAMTRLNAKNTPIDLLTLTEELKRSGDLDAIGGRFTLIQLTEKVASAVNIEHHARIIFQKYIQREIIRLGTDMQTNAYDDTKDVQEMLNDAENGLFNLSHGSMKRDVQQIRSVIDEAIMQMEDASKRIDQLSGVPSGFTGIDRVTSGWQAASLVIIAARPAMGKTAFVLSMARKMAVENNVPVAMFSLEMANVELVKRLLTAETEIPMEKIKNGRLTTSEWEHFRNNLNNLSNAPIYIDDTPGLSIFDLRSKCRLLKKKHNIGVIIIDYLQLMTAAAMRPGNRQEEVSMISRSLKGLAKELNIPVIALSQLNRNVESRGVGKDSNSADGKRPQLSDLRESGAIEQDADMVCFIHRPEYYKIEEDKDGSSLKGIGLFIIAKHRSGGLDDVKLRFTPELVRFDDYDGTNMFNTNNNMPMTSQTFSSKMNSGAAGQAPFMSDANIDPYGNESFDADMPVINTDPTDDVF
jgi:replicative DNA helicase